MLKFKKTYSEEEIVKGCVANERKYQEILYKQHFPKMMTMVMRYTRDEDKAMEILNNGFLKIFKKLHTFESRGSLEGWIRRIVYHSISDYFKKESKYLKVIVLDDKERERASNVNALDQLFYDDLLDIVNTLPSKSRKVFHFYAIEGYTHAEIGKMMGISTGTSKWHLSNARAILKETIYKRLKANYAG